MEIFIGWLFFSGLVAHLASGRGRSAAAWFVLALAISPVISAVVLYALPDESPENNAGVPEGMEGMSSAPRSQAESASGPAARQGGASHVSGAALAQEIVNLASLRNVGVLSDEEFVLEKAKAIETLMTRHTTASIADFLLPFGELLTAGVVTHEELSRLKSVFRQISRDPGAPQAQRAVVGPVTPGELPAP